MAMWRDPLDELITDLERAVPGRPTRVRHPADGRPLLLGCPGHPGA